MSYREEDACRDLDKWKQRPIDYMEVREYGKHGYDLYM